MLFPSFKGMLMDLIVFLVALLLTFIVFRFITSIDIKKLLLNSVAGLISLFLLNALGITIPITLFNIILIAITGFIGLVILLILYFLGVL